MEEEYDIDGVMDLFDDDVVFEHWDSARIKGKEPLRKAWAPWFADNGGFRFVSEDLFIDEEAQKVLFRWRLEWPSRLKGLFGKAEVRRGVDVMHFSNGLITHKFTYSKTTVTVDGEPKKAAYS